MAFTDLIKPGDKIDIRLLQQVENEERTGDTVKVYKSQVLDINKRGNLEISMPTEGTKLILLPLDVRLEFVFYSGGFLYKSIGQIVERFKHPLLPFYSNGANRRIMPWKIRMNTF